MPWVHWPRGSQPERGPDLDPEARDSALRLRKAIPIRPRRAAAKLRLVKSLTAPWEDPHVRHRSAMIINALVLGAILGADLGPHRKSSWFRLARPLVLAALLVPVYLKGLITHGTDVILELAAAVAGLLLGLVLMP